MVIKNVSLDIVCGITSKLPDTGRTRRWLLQVSQMWGNLP